MRAGTNVALEVEARPAERHVVLAVEAPAVPVERFLRLPLRGEAFAWDAGAEGAFAARGDAVIIDASGPARFERVKAEAKRFAAGIIPAAEARLVRDVRFFGGFAFEPTAGERPGDAGSRAAASLGDASFRVGEWSYETFGASAVLRRVVPEGRFRADQRELVRELEALARALGDVPPIELSPPTTRATAPSEEGAAAFSAEVASATDAIALGRFTKVTLSRRASLPLARALDTGKIVAAMRALEPECTRFFVSRGDVAFFGATPERLVTLERRDVRVDALAGSAPREEGAADALLASDKERREHVIVIDAVRESLADLVDDLTIPPTTLRTFRCVHHLWTPVSARAKAGVHVLDLVEALHPTPAVSGYPRALARSWIQAREPHTRGWYAAPVGWFDESGSGSFGVAIRSALVQGRTAWLHAGAGVVAGSEPARELAETSTKLSPMRDALALAGAS